MAGDRLSDLKVVALAAAVPLTLLLSGVAADSALRPVLAAPLLSIIPGYAVLAALLPNSGPLARPESDDGMRPIRETDDEGRYTESPLAGVAWWVGTLVVGVLAVAAMARVLLATSIKYDAESVLVGVAIVVGAGLAVAAYRRGRRSPLRRYEANPRAWVAGAGDLFGADDAGDVLVSVALVASVLLVLGSVGFAATAGQQGPEYTEFYLLNQNDSGDVAGNYPTDVGPDETAELTVGLANHEGETETYTVVVEVQRLENRTADAAVLERREITRMQATVDDGDTWRASHSIDSPFYGDNVRVRYYLYRGEAPEDPDADSAYRHLGHWLSAGGA